MGRVMKYAHNMPKLEEPNFILSPPILVQYFVIFIAFLASIGIAWQSYTHFLTEPLWKICIGFFTSMCFLAISAHPKMWQRWVFFAVDRKGCYFSCNWTLLQHKDFYKFVPWLQIGDIYLGKDADDSKSIILKLKIRA